MADQDFRVKNGLNVGGLQVIDSARALKNITTSTLTQNTYTNILLSNTNSYIATKVDTATVGSTYETKATANTRLANTNSYVGTKLASATYTAADVQSKAALANTNSYIATMLVSATAATTYESKANANTRLANTNVYIGTMLPSATATTTYESKANANTRLANTNAYIATMLPSASYTTADVQSKAALANTNSYIATKLASATYTTADVQSKAALANTNSYIATMISVANTASLLGDIKTNIVLNAFRIAVNGALSYYNIVDGILDEFEDETGINVATSNNESYNSTADSYSNLIESTTDALLTTYSTNYINYTFRVRVANTALQPGFTQFRARFQAGSSEALTMDAVYVGENDTATANAWDYDGNQVQLLFGGSTTGTAAIGANTWSDWVTFSANNAKNICVGFDMNSVAGNGGIKYTTAAPTGWNAWNRGNADTAATTSPTSMNDEGQRSYVVSEVATRVGGANMILQSNTFGTSTAPTEAYLVTLIEPVDAITINTDVKMFVSRDGGNTFTEGTLVNKTTFAAGVNVYDATVDVSAQPNGNSMVWKLQSYNSKTIAVHGTSMQWS